MHTRTSVKKGHFLRYLLLISLFLLVPSVLAQQLFNSIPVNNTVTNASTVNVTSSISASLVPVNYQVNTTNASNGQTYQLCINGLIPQSSSFSCIADFTNLADGVYNITAYLVASITDVRSNTTYNITIDRTRPSIALNNPVNTTSFDPGKINFEFTPTDNLDTLIQCDLFVDGTNTTTFNVSNSTVSTAYAVDVRSVDTHSWYVSCTDNANNANVSSTFTFRIINNGGGGGGGGGSAQSHPAKQSKRPPPQRTLTVRKKPVLMPATPPKSTKGTKSATPPSKASMSAPSSTTAAKPFNEVNPAPPVPVEQNKPTQEIQPEIVSSPQIVDQSMPVPQSQPPVPEVIPPTQTAVEEAKQQSAEAQDYGSAPQSGKTAQDKTRKHPVPTLMPPAPEEQAQSLTTIPESIMRYIFPQGGKLAAAQTAYPWGIILILVLAVLYRQYRKKKKMRKNEQPGKDKKKD